MNPTNTGASGSASQVPGIDTGPATRPAVSVPAYTIDRIVDLHYEVLTKLDMALYSPEVEKRPCYIRSAIFAQVRLMHELNLAIGVAA